MPTFKPNQYVIYSGNVSSLVGKKVLIERINSNTKTAVISFLYPKDTKLHRNHSMGDKDGKCNFCFLTPINMMNLDDFLKEAPNLRSKYNEI